MAESLNSIMNDVASMLDGMGEGQRSFQPISQGEPLSEMDAFAQLDPLLAQLHKDYIDARAMRSQAVREYGADDAMTEMAAYTEDSAWCAMQTRYMELRADRAMMAKAQMTMREEEELLERQKREEQQDRALKFYRQMEAQQEYLKSKKHNAAEVAFYYMLLMILPGSIFDMFPRTAQSFNRLAA
jgi:hypothetical protein